jgi:outer membrane protein
VTAVRTVRAALRGLLVAAAACVATAGAQAQSLIELYNTARGYDATFLGSRALADSAEYRAAQVHALRRPVVGVDATVGRNENRTPVTDSRADGGSATISATQPLFNMADNITISQADRDVVIAQANLELAEQDLIVRVAQAYFDVLAAQDVLNTSRTSKDAIAEQLASAKRNFEVGTATITDTREAQARFDLATAVLIGAENDLQVKRAALDQLIGRSNVEPRPLAPSATLPPLDPPSIDAWMSQVDQSPIVRKAALTYEIAKLETDKARAGHLPTVDLNGSYGRGRTDVAGSQNYNGGTRQSSIGVTLTLPLFTGFSVQNRIKETLLLEEQARNGQDAATRSVELATRQAFLGVQSQLAQVTALEAALSSSQLSLEATQLGYRVGVRVNLDVLNAQTQLYTAQRDLARARYDVLLNNLKLRQAAGRLTPEDVSRISDATR